MRSSTRSVAAIAVWLTMLVAVSSLVPPGPAQAVELVQYFPATPPGAPPAPPETGWRIRYQILPQLSHGYGGAAVWELQSVEFMRGYNEFGQPDWVKVLNNLALAGRAIADLAVTPRSALQILSVIESKPTSRRYGHRLVAVWRDGPPPSRRVLVDLTTEQVVDANF